MKKDFESQLRKQMEGYEVAPPDDLWLRIEGSMAPSTRLSSQQGNTRRIGTAVLARWMAAAAALLLVVGGAGLLLLRQQQDTTASVGKTAVPTAAKEPQEQETQQPPALTEPERLPGSGRVLSLARVPIIYNAGTEKTVLANQQQPSPPTQATETPQHAPGLTTADGETTDSAAGSKRPDVHTITVDRDRKPQEWQQHSLTAKQPAPQEADARLMASVHFDGSLRGASSAVNPVYMSDEMYRNFSEAEAYTNRNTRAANNATLTDYEETYQYHTPTRFGLSLSYRLADRWVLLSGVSYMKQRTLQTQRMREHSLQTQYDYEYIGVPVGVSYRVADLGPRLTVYATAGLEAYFNYKALADIEGMEQHLHKDRPQIAATTALGLQLNLPLRFGIFVEPGFVYYFDNGSAANTRMKDKPCEGAFLFGLRYAIK